MRKVVIIGSGFSGLASAALLAKAGWNVTVLEKHNQPGGRARKFESDGFTFDMGPSWYWMPDVFERYFGLFGKKVSDYYTLKRLDPSYKIFWKKESFEVPAEYSKLEEAFEKKESGASKNLRKFLKGAKYKYDIGINNLVHKPGKSLGEFIDLQFLTGIFKLEVFTSIKKHVAKYFKNSQIRQILEFPILFLGALPENTPALYSLMNYADIKLGTWYPDGGMYRVVDAMHRVALEHDVEFFFEHTVSEFQFNGKSISSVTATHNGIQKEFIADAVIASADYHFVETALLPRKLRSYTDKYWESRKMAPSCLLYYVGLNKKIKDLEHHMLFFDVDFDKHAENIYKSPEWPKEPLFYVSATSVSDDSVAPMGMENLFFLIPVAAGLSGDDTALRNHYFDKIIKRFEEKTGQEIRSHIVFSKNFGPSDFVNDYNAFKGNAYGLANTLLQTAILKPSCKSKKVANLYYTGQLTIPGPGVPPSIISGEVVAKELIKNMS